MNNEDAEKVIWIMLAADGDCAMCAQDLLLRFSKAFPEHKSLCKEIYNKAFDSELKEDEN